MPDNFSEILSNVAQQRNQQDTQPKPHVLPPMQVTAPRQSALQHLVKAIHALVNPTAGAESPDNDEDQLPPEHDHETANNQLKQTFRNTKDPKEKARIQRRVSESLKK